MPATLALTRNPSFPFERVFWALAVFFLLAIPIVLWLLLPNHNADTLARIGERLQRDPRLYLGPLAVFAAIIWHQRTRYREQLLINAHGIHYTPPFSWWPQHAYSLAWSEIDTIELRPAGRFQAAAAVPVLNLQAKGRRITIWPLRWFRPQLSWAEHRQRQQLRRRGDLASTFAGCAIGQQLAVLGQTVQTPPGEIAGFDLFAHPQCRGIVIALFVLVAYALLDALLVQQRYLAFTPWPLLALGAVLATISVSILLRRFAVPVLEAVTVALLFGLALGAAGHSALLRLNQFSDWDGSQTVSYVRQTDGQFMADGFPPIAVEPLEPYWDQYPRGQLYSFTLYRGSLGFWQLDEAPVNTQMRAFYRARDQRTGD